MSSSAWAHWAGLVKSPMFRRETFFFLRGSHSDRLTSLWSFNYNPVQHVWNNTPR